MTTSIVCTCCDHRYWPDPTPQFPTAWICPSCQDWVMAFDLGRQPGAIPLVGPVRTLRDVLAGRDVTVDDFAADTSTWVLINTTRTVAERWQQLIEPQPTPLQAVR